MRRIALILAATFALAPFAATLEAKPATAHHRAIKAKSKTKSKHKARRHSKARRSA